MTSHPVELLEGYRYAALLEMARFNGIPHQHEDGRDLDKAGLVHVLSEQLFTPQRLDEALRSIGHRERAVLHRVLLQGDRVDAGQLRARLTEEGVIPPASPATQGACHEGRPHDAGTNAFEDVIARLTLRGLLLSEGIPNAWGRRKMLGLTPGLNVIVPPAVRRFLTEPVSEEMNWGRGSLPAPVLDADIASSQRDLFIYWSEALTRPLPLTQAGLVRKRVLRQVNRQLLSPDPSLESARSETEAPRIFFLRLMLQELGLLVQRNQHLETSSPPGQLPTFWGQPLMQRVARAVEAWQAIETWNELSGLGLASLDLDLFRAREKLLEQLATLPVGDWISSERFSDHLLLNRLNLLIEPHNQGPRGSVLRGEDELAGRFNQRLADIQAAFVGRALSGPLHWLGLLDISVDDDRLLAFRVGEQGARALGDVVRLGTKEYGPPDDGNGPVDEGRVVVQPSFHVLALGPVPESVLAQLEIFADRLKADRSAFEYVLSQETVYRGQQWGLSVDDILATLRKMSSVPIPANVQRSLREWEQQYERIVFHNRVTLVHTSNAGQLEELWQDGALRRHLARRLGPTVATVEAGRLSALHQALRRKGVLAARSRQHDACVDSLRAEPSGELVPVRDGPDLLLDTCLAKLTEAREGKHFVTQNAVTRALDRGMTVSQYLDLLARVHRGPLPGELRARVKAWGRYYGKATLRTATLLEVRDAQTAEELLSQPELAPYLTRFPSDPHGRLLLVQGEDLNAVRDLLTDHGVDLR
jgi:hypothetical protein